MSKLKDINTLFVSDYSEELNHGDSKHGNINRNGYFYHVTQQCWNHRNFYSFDAARYRDTLIKSACTTHNVTLIMNVIMPNHSHEVFYSQDFSNIQQVLKGINSKVARFIVSERKEVFEKETPKVFQDRPTYTLIENRTQFYYLIYYLFHNGDFLKESGKQIPLSCFDLWKQNKYKGYKIELFELLFEQNVQQIMNKCEQLSKEDYQMLSKKLFDKYKKSDQTLFVKN